MSRNNMKTLAVSRWTKVCGWLLIATTLAVEARENFSTVEIVPAPRQVKLDGDLREWPAAALIESFYDQSLYPNFSLRIGWMYDARALYIGAHFVDATPLVNANDPAVNPKQGWMGDALQVRLISDAAAPYPYPDGRDSNDRICHLTMWYCTARQLPVVSLEYGMDYHGLKTYVGADSGAVFRADADGKGYTLEARIPWERLQARPRQFQAGDEIALTIQPHWSNDSGTASAITFFELTGRPGVAYQSAAVWGRARFAASANIAPRPNPALAASGDATGKPLRIQLRLPDPQASMISLGLFSPDRGLVRTLPPTIRRESQRRAEFELAWDGLDDDGQPLPAGEYQLKILTHRGIGQKFIASLGQSGNPPWRTDDGTGAWGGDWAPPVAAAADNQRVYLGWGVCEAGPALVCVEKSFDAQGRVRKVWGSHPSMHNDVGMMVTALATDGERLFVAQDGPPWGQGPEKAFAAVTVYDVRNGRPLTFPTGKPSLLLLEWDARDQTAKQAKPLFERRKTGDFAPHQQGANLTGIAVQGDRLYAALLISNQVVALNWKTGEKLATYPVEAPSGVAVEATGKVIVAAKAGLVRIDPTSGATETLAAGQLSRPWGVSVDATGNIAVADCGTAMQVKVFRPDGTLVRTVGKPGGRAWVGAYDATGMLMPAGLATDADGKLWVTERDDFPPRVSVWDTAGKVVGDFHGPCVPQTDRGVNPANPKRINCQMVEYELDYDTGQSRCVATLWRPHVDGWSPIGNFGRASRFLIRHAQGREYGFLDHGYADRLG